MVKSLVRCGMGFWKDNKQQEHNRIWSYYIMVNQGLFLLYNMVSSLSGSKLYLKIKMQNGCVRSHDDGHRHYHGIINSL